jgi:site-specific recombinase XerD
MARMPEEQIERNRIPLEGFLASLERRGYRPATVAAWRGSLRRFFGFVQSAGVSGVRVPMELFFSFGRELSAQGLPDAAICRHENRVIKFYIWLVKKEN